MEILDNFCPSKVIYSRPDDCPWITEEMKNLKRRILREYEKRGKTDKYRSLKQSYESKLQSGAQKYRAKLEEDIISGNSNSSYAALRKLGVRPGDNTGNTFTLPAHAESNFTARQSAETIADHFANISQDYEAIKIANFPPKMRDDLSNPDVSVVPQLEEYEVYQQICKAKKPNSTVPGDMPKRIVQEFSCCTSHD